jgi:hypothetical protein
MTMAVARRRITSSPFQRPVQAPGNAARGRLRVDSYPYIVGAALQKNDA